MSESLWQRLGAEVESFRAGIREERVMRVVTPAALRAELESRYTFETALPLGDVVEDVMRLLREWTVHSTHPRYFGLFNPSVREAAIAGDVLAALYNPQLAAWSHAPAAQELERLTLRRFAVALGLDGEGVAANFTSGGAEANLTGVLAALSHHFPDSGSTGLARLGARPALYVTAESHHSFVKIARMTGLGTQSLREVPVTGRFTMDVAALRELLQSDADAGWHPLLIVGTAGSTATGTIDPLPAIADVAARFGAWLHVDAAWGAAAVLAPRLRGALAGIERADSITWDAHKWLSVPMGAGMFFCRHADALRRAFALTTSYMPEATAGGAVEPYAMTVQWSRRAIGLKVFMALAELGIAGYGALIEQQARMGELLRERLAGAGWIVLNDSPLPVVCFSAPEIRNGDIDTRAILDTIHERGRVWISDVAPANGEPMLRACITSYRTDESDIDCLLDEVEHARAHARRDRLATGQPG